MGKKWWLRDALKVLDKEGNGMVSSAELRHIVANLKVKTEKIGDEMVHTPIGDEELDEAMEEIDPKKAGQIKIDHLVKEVFKKVKPPPNAHTSTLPHPDHPTDADEHRADDPPCTDADDTTHHHHPTPNTHRSDAPHPDHPPTAPTPPPTVTTLPPTSDDDHGRTPDHHERTTS